MIRLEEVEGWLIAVKAIILFAGLATLASLVLIPFGFDVTYFITVSIAIFTVFSYTKEPLAKKLKNLKSQQPSEKLNYLGEWSAYWGFTVPRNHWNKKTENFVISSVDDDMNICAKSHNEDVGDYELEGKIEDTIIQLNYSLKNNRQGSHGVVLFIRTSDPNLLEGRWMQFYSAGKIAHGTVKLERKVRI